MFESRPEVDRVFLEIDRAVAIANSVISSNKGVAKALASFPWPIHYVMAAVVAKSGEYHLQRVLFIYTLKFELFRREQKYKGEPHVQKS